MNIFTILLILIYLFCSGWSLYKLIESVRDNKYDDYTMNLGEYIVVVLLGVVCLIPIVSTFIVLYMVYLHFKYGDK